MFKRLSILAIFSIFSLMVSPPALSITEINHLDGNGHPWVVLLLMEIDGKPAYRCSGTLLSPTVLSLPAILSLTS